MTPTYAVVPSLGRDCLTGCLESLLPQVDLLFLVRTEEYGIPEIADPLRGKIVAIDDLIRPKNIQRWWNLGITAAESWARMKNQDEWNVLVTNDDVIACPHLAETLDLEMRKTTAVLSYPDNFEGDRWVFHTVPGPVAITTRISGWCWMIRGGSGLFADDRFEWWYGDDDLDWRARESGGSLMVPGCKVEHLSPGKLTGESPELTARTHLDRRLFEDKWSAVPH
jgi:hypothetical protein